MANLNIPQDKEIIDPLNTVLFDLQQQIQSLQQQLKKKNSDTSKPQNDLNMPRATPIPQEQFERPRSNVSWSPYEVGLQNDQPNEIDPLRVQLPTQGTYTGVNFPPLSQQVGQNPNTHHLSGGPSDRGIPRDTFLRRLRSIPKFDGEGYAQLKEFIEVVDSLYISCANQSEEDELSQQTLLQLRGEARNIIMALGDTDWRSIKSKLLKYFKYLANKDILTSQLENVRQLKDESLAVYADRVRKLLRDKNATYAYMTEEQKSEHNRIARKSFAKGITNFRLRDRLLTRGASSLEDAIAYAIEVENDDMHVISRSEIFCRNCNQTGHLYKDCRRRNFEQNEMSRLISALQSMGKPNSQSRYNNIPQWNRNDWGQRSSMPSPNSNQNNFRRPNNFNNNNWSNAQNRGRNFNGNGYQPRGWNSGPEYSNPNRNMNSQNRNWNSNYSAQNRNWTNNQYQPRNGNWNRNNGNTSDSSNSNGNGNARNLSNNQPSNDNRFSASNRQNPNNHSNQPRSGERSRQVYFSTPQVFPSVGHSSSESPTPEN